MSSPSRPAPPDGGPGPLDVLIRDKAFRAADGSFVPAIAEIAFAAPAGSFTILAGPSGCGKTTTLRIVLGLDRDFFGHVRLPGLEPRTAAVFQEPRLLPWRTVEENIRLALPAGLAETDLAPLLQTLGLTDMRARYPAELSLGLARRAALARAFAIEPSLILLDEPFVSLDEPTAARLRRSLLDLWRMRPTTVLMVTHNLREALELADRIVLLSARPATVRGFHDIATPRAERGDPWREAELAKLGAAFPGLM